MHLYVVSYSYLQHKYIPSNSLNSPKGDFRNTPTGPVQRFWHFFSKIAIWRQILRLVGNIQINQNKPKKIFFWNLSIHMFSTPKYLFHTTNSLRAMLCVNLKSKNATYFFSVFLVDLRSFIPQPVKSYLPTIPKKCSLLRGESFGVT